MIRIDLAPSGEDVTMQLIAFLGPERFGVYRDLCQRHGARYLSARKLTVATLTVLPALLRDLVEAKLPVTIDPQLAGRLQAEAAEATQLLTEGRARLEAAETQLAPRGLRLYPYQRTGVEWLAPRRRALLADEMGLGKTPQALMALPERAAALVVAPSAVAHNWAAETRRWRRDLKASVIPGRNRWSWPWPGEVRICTYGMLPDEDNIPVPPRPVVVIADEAHLVKSPKAQRTQRFRAVVATACDHGGRAWALTGTPMLNRPPELWAVLSAMGLADEAFGSWFRFTALFHAERTNGRGYEWGTADEAVPELLRKVALRRHRADVLPDLPAKLRRDLIVGDLDPATIRACDEVVQALRQRGIDLQQLASDVQISKAQGVVFELLSRARAQLAAAKVGALLELVEAYEEEEVPVVVFSAHTAPVEAVAARAGWGLITGATPAAARGRIVEDFQAGRLRGIAGTIAAMGVGVTLTHAHHLILVDLAWTPALNSQAEDRVARIGQTRGVIVTRLIADHPIDARVVELLTAKQEAIEAAVEASAVEADYVGPSPAEAMARAAGEAQRLAAQAAAGAEQARAQAQQQAQERRQQVLAALDGHDGREVDLSDDARFRGPCSAAEDHAHHALLALAGMDRDGAREINDAGFSRMDSGIGRSLAQQLLTTGRLSAKQWEIARSLAHRYRRQVGEPTTSEVEA